MLQPNIADNINVATGRQDPNASRRGLDANYEDFLKLLTVQLQNQDPTAPFDTNQMTQQIATLSQVEQQINTNRYLEQLIGVYNATQFSAITNYLGKSVEVEGKYMALQGDHKAQLIYYLPQDAETLSITVKDGEGNIVYTGPGAKTMGRNTFTWDGRNNAGEKMPDDIYEVSITAKDASNQTIDVRTLMTGIVTSVDSAGGEVYLTVNHSDLTFNIKSVLSIGMPETQVADATPTPEATSAPTSAPDAAPDSAPDSGPVGQNPPPTSPPAPEPPPPNDPNDDGTDPTSPPDPPPESPPDSAP